LEFGREYSLTADDQNISEPQEAIPSQKCGSVSTHLTKHQWQKGEGKRKNNACNHATETYNTYIYM
jgi:hypothetical protein